MVLAAREASETFIAREIRALQRGGFPLAVAEVAALPQDAVLKPGVRREVDRRVAQRMVEEVCAGSLRNAVRLWRHRCKARALAAEALACGAERIHAQFAWVAADLAGVVAGALGVPWSCSVHAWDVFTRPLPELRRRLRGVGFVVACNDAAASVARRAACHGTAVHLIRHGMELPLEPMPGGKLEASSTLVFAVGRLVRKKGFDLLLEACGGLARRGRKFDLVLVGEGPERGRLGKLAEWLGIKNSVAMAGALPHGEVLKKMAGASMLVLPSRRLRNGDKDGFANVLAEAMALSVPVVTTTAAGAGELLRNEENALLVEPENVAELARAMERLLEDVNLRKKLTENALKTLKKHMDARVELDTFSKVLFG